MENKELVSLLKKHTEAQETANCLYSEIVNELANRGLEVRCSIVLKQYRTTSMGRISLIS